MSTLIRREIVSQNKTHGCQVTEIDHSIPSMSLPSIEIILETVVLLTAVAPAKLRTEEWHEE